MKKDSEHNISTAEQGKRLHDKFTDIIYLARLERQRQRYLQEDDPDKIAGYGRRYPILPLYLAAEKRIAEIELSMDMESPEHLDRDFISDHVFFMYETEVETLSERYHSTGPVLTRSEQLDLFEKTPVELLSTTNPYDGITCESYGFVNDSSEDVAIVRIVPGGATPRQRVLEGERTVEGYVRGIGALAVESVDGSLVEYEFTGAPFTEPREVGIEVGQIMQWRAGSEELIFSELCRPPYSSGRFEDLSD